MAQTIVGCTSRVVGKLAKPQIGAGDDILPSDDVREAGDPPGDRLRMLDKARAARDDARDRHLALRQLVLLR